MAYISGEVYIERVLRPGAAEELLALKPSKGGKAIVFDLEASLKRVGLVNFIKECQQSQSALLLGADGMLQIPSSLQNRFEFYNEFYGLSRNCLLEVDILVAAAEEEKKQEEKAGGKSESTGEDSLKKLDAPAPKEKPKKKKISFKLEPRNINTVPAGIVHIVDSQFGQAGPKPKPLTPTALSNRLGAQRISINRFALGVPATAVKSFGLSGPRR